MLSDKAIEEWLKAHKNPEIYKTGIIADFLNRKPEKLLQLQQIIRDEYKVFKKNSK